MKQLQPMLDALKQVRPVTHRGQLSNVNLKKSMKIQLANRNLPVSRIQQKVVTQDIIHNDTKQNSNLSTIGGGMTSRENFTGLQSMSSVSRSSTPNTFHRRHKSSTHISAINQNILSGKLGTMQDPSEQIKYYQDYLREHQQSQKQLKQDLSSTLKLYEVDDIKILEDQYNQNTNKQKTELSDSHYTSDHQETLDKGIMTTRQPIEKQLNQSMNSRLKSQSRVNNTHNQNFLNQTLETQTKSKNFILDQSLQQKQVQSQKQPESSQINSKKRIDRYDFELKLQNIEKTYHQFEEFFNEYREEKQKEQIKEIFNPNEIGENFRENQSISYNYAQSMTNALVNSQKIHDMIESKFYKFQILKREINNLHQSLNHISYNRIVGDQKIIFQDLKSTKCMCKNNNFMKRAQFRPENIGKNTNQEEQKQTFSQASSFHHRKRSLGRIQQQPSQNQNKFNSHHYNQGPIKLQLQATNQNRDLRILIEGHAPITINLNNLLLEQTQNCVAQPIDEYLNQKPAVDLNNMFMEEIQKQNRDIKIFEQLQSSFIKEPEAKLLQPNKNSEIQNLENQEYLKHLIDTDNKESNNHNTWKMHQNHLDRTKSKIKQQDLNSNQDAQQEQSQNILENEVMRSLFDIEMCVACKYQKILYLNFIQQIQKLDMDSQRSSSKLDLFIKETIESYLNKTASFSDQKETQKLISKLIILQTDQLKQIGKILPLHTLLNEKVFKFFAFIMQMTFQLYNESFQDFQKKCQNLQSELADLNYTRSDNDLLQMELVTLKQQLSEANDLLSIYNQDRQVVIKDIEKDILELNQNFNSHSRHQLKLKENIEKDVKLAINDISDQNKSQNENLLDMMNIILKKFEIVKYSLNQNSSIGTQTIIVGQQRIHTDQSQNKDSVQHGKSFYWKSLEVFRPLLSYELQRRRYFEVFEVQQICEEFISFITKIKLKNLENLHIPLQKLPYTITQETKQERLKNGNKRLNRPQSNIQLTYTLDKKVSPLMKDIIRYGSKDEMLNLMVEFLLFKNQNNKKGDMISIDVNHLFQSLEKVCVNKKHISSKMILLIFNYQSDFQDVEDIHYQNDIGRTTRKVKNQVSQIGNLTGELININSAVNEKITQMTYQTYYLIEKILKKEKYINTVFSQFLNDQTLALHSTDLLNKKLSLRIIFILFEIMLGKLQLQLKTELIDSIYHHYAQGDDYREASQISKYFSLIAVQVMMKNKSSTMHYDWLIEQLYGLITTQTQVSIQDLINDDFTNENVFNMVQKQFERTKDDSLHSTNVFNFQMHQIEEQKSPSENKSQSPSFIQSKSTFQRQPSYRRTAQAKTALIQLASSNSKKTSPIMPRGKESNYTLLDNSVSLSPSPNVLKSRFDKDQLDEENYDFTELNHITDQSIKNKLDARKEFIIKDLNMEKFIRLLNYQKIQLPCIKDALRDYKSFFIQDDEFKQEQIRIEKPANQIKTEQQYLSFLYIMKQENLNPTLDNFFTVLRRYLINERSVMVGLLDFVSLFILLVMKNLDSRKHIVLEKYKQLDVNGKGLKEVELNQLLMQLDFHRQLKQKQFQHIIDEIKFAKIHQLMQLNQKAQSNSNTLSQNTQAVNSVQQQNVIGLNQTILITNQQPHTPSNLDQHNNHDKVEEFQRQLEDKKSDSFMMFKYKEIQDVIENKWWIIKELNSVRDDFLSIAQDIEKKKLLNKIRQKTLSNLKEKQKQTELSSLNNTAGKQHVKNGRSFDQSISDKQSHSITD